MNPIATVGCDFRWTGCLPVELHRQMRQTIQVNKENRTIAITATDKVTAMADQATVHIGFIAYGVDSNSAYATGSRGVERHCEGADGGGRAKETIQSENQHLAAGAALSDGQADGGAEGAAAVPGDAELDGEDGCGDAAKRAGSGGEGGSEPDRRRLSGASRTRTLLQAAGGRKALKRARAQAEQMASGSECEAGLAALCEQRDAGSAAADDATMSCSCAAMDKVEPLAINPRRD